MAEGQQQEEEEGSLGVACLEGGVDGVLLAEEEEAEGEAHELGKGLAELGLAAGHEGLEQRLDAVLLLRGGKDEAEGDSGKACDLHRDVGVDDDGHEQFLDLLLAGSGVGKPQAHDRPDLRCRGGRRQGGSSGTQSGHGDGAKGGGGRGGGQRHGDGLIP